MSHFTERASRSQQTHAHLTLALGPQTDTPTLTTHQEAQTDVRTKRETHRQRDRQTNSLSLSLYLSLFLSRFAWLRVTDSFSGQRSIENYYTFSVPRHALRNFNRRDGMCGRRHGFGYYLVMLQLLPCFPRRGGNGWSEGQSQTHRRVVCEVWTRIQQTTTLGALSLYNTPQMPTNAAY